MSIEGKQRVVVGFNEFVMASAPAKPLPVDPAVGAALADRLAELRRACRRRRTLAR